LFYTSKLTRFSTINLSSRPTSLGFAKVQVHSLFISTEEDVFQYALNGIDNCKKFTLDASRGCSLNCGSVHNNGSFYIANSKEGIFRYKNTQERQAELDPIRNLNKSPISNPKLLMCYLSSYVILVAQDADRSEESARSHLSIYNFSEEGASSMTFKSYEYSTQPGQKITHVLQEKNKKLIFLVILQGPAEYVIKQVEEKDTQAKLEFLRKKHLFDVAVTIAEKSQQASQSYEVETWQSWGDFLFSKMNYREAVDKYKKTIPQLEPSYVIRKFLDQQRYEELILYLEELHSKEVANNDHTVLLLNCYTRSNNENDSMISGQKNVQAMHEQVTQKLSGFLFESNFKYDARTAVNVLRQTGYHELALTLARKQSTKDLLIKILIEDFGNDNPVNRFTSALQEIENLPDADKYMRKYAKILITKLPYKTTNLLIRLCTNTFKPEADQNAARIIPKLDAAVQSNSDSLGSLFSSFFSNTPADNKPEDTKENKDKKALASARDFIYAYADQTYWLMVFLENVVYRYPHDPKLMPPVVYNTLLELYLKYWSISNVSTQYDSENHYEKLYSELHANQVLEEFQSDKNGINKNYTIHPPTEAIKNNDFSTKIMDLLNNCLDAKTNQTYYDEEHALVLTQSKKFNEGVLFLYTRLGLYYDILQHYMEEGDSNQIIETCNKFGGNDPNMWIQVLSYFANPDYATRKRTLNSSSSDGTEDIKRILTEINANNYLPPLIVVQILSQNPTIKLNVIKDFLKQKLREEQQKTEKHMEEIKKYQDETTKLQEEIEELRTSVKIFQVSRCSQCLDPLDLPAVHFMCMHSYHQRCLAADVEECIKCAAKNKETVKMPKLYDDQLSLQEEFKRNLDNNPDNGFDVIAQYFGRGIFKPSIFAEAGEDN